MRIAVINETSAADRNADILAALEGQGIPFSTRGWSRTARSRS
jgi:hypothetical protein